MIEGTNNTSEGSMRKMVQRSSSYPMISVEDALVHVLQQSDALEAKDVALEKCYGLRSWGEVRVETPFPAFPVSIMDGYALRAPLVPGIYPVQSRVRAGDSDNLVLQAGHVVYITTGARMPIGADAVVKVEDTASVGTEKLGGLISLTSFADLKTSTNDNKESPDESRVNINVSVSASGVNVREVGSDMAVGEVLLAAGQLIGAAEVGLLASAGVRTVKCFCKPVIGVLSTGNELVDASSPEPLQGSQIRDSNRAALLAALRSDGYDVIDLGIIGDTRDALREMLLTACREVDVLVTSGGVSMGDADLVKPMLAELGTVHFGRLNMKPGKPTTFATIPRPGKNGAKTMVFGLPGNPASCLVTKALFVDPCLRRLQGDSSERALHTQLRAVLTGSPLKLDPERAEYHRGILTLNAVTGSATVRSTGNQRSSRLLSMGASNALICLPQGSGSVAEGESVTVILTGAAMHAALPAQDGRTSVHRKAALLDETDTSVGAFAGKSAASGDAKEVLGLTSLQSLTGALPVPTSDVARPSETKSSTKITMRVGLLTISDRANSGTYKDDSGPEMAKLLQSMSWALSANIVHTAVVPDEPQLIRQKMVEWIDSGSIDLLLTSGGTGFGRRDNTPEAIRPMLHREAPGVAQALINEGLKHTPLAALSRPVAGTRGACFVATLPGSVKAVRENIQALVPLLPRIMELVIANTCSHASGNPLEGYARMCECCK